MKVVATVTLLLLELIYYSAAGGQQKRSISRITDLFPSETGGVRHIYRPSAGDNGPVPAEKTWLSMGEVEEKLTRIRRQAGQPTLNGDYTFNDQNNRGYIHYSGSSSPVIIVLTITVDRNQVVRLNSSNLYRSSDYGVTFATIDTLLNSPNDPHPSLWGNMYNSPVNNQLIVLFSYGVRNLIYYSLNEGASWTAQPLTPPTLDARTLVWSPANDRAALAHDPTTDQLYITQDLGQHWTKISDHVDSYLDYQWGDPNYDPDISMVYFNTYNPNDQNRGNFTVSMYTQHYPYTSATVQEFDPSLGRHDDFLLQGPYIYAQKTNSNGVISLYTSYRRGKFKKANIPSAQPHQNYLVSHIDALQALVVIQHTNGQFNLYLSDITAVYFSLSLSNLTHNNFVLDLDIVDGVNGTLMANQYIGGGSSGPTRSLISLDNGANWELVRPPASSDCSPPQCSLHLHMRTTSYGRTAIYSQASAPGLIVAHGNTGQALTSRPDLYISRDGGVTWSLTLQGSWGVTVLDHGGLLVAAKDYHQEASNLLQYSCDEGLHWQSYSFTRVGMTVYGVITEPGEHTTVVSFYGVKQNSNSLSVVTVGFDRIFPRTCTGLDFYQWHPWDDRTDQNCILGSSVTIERRNSSVCCLIGQDYSRPTQFSRCRCSVDDFECDYGFKHAGEFTGLCVRDSSVQLPPSACDSDGDGTLIYSETRGYRKVAGDVCFAGVTVELGPVTRSCCVEQSHCLAKCVLEVAACVSTSLGYTCRCFPGYYGDGTSNGTGCTAINLCTSSSSSPCASHAVCSRGGSSSSSYSCTCNPGYTGDGFLTGSGCTNINECITSQSDCASLATCVDTDSSYTCECPSGYHGDGKKSGNGCSFHDVQPTVKAASSTSSTLMVAVVILAVLFALSLCAVVVLMSAILVWKCKRRQGDGRRYEVVSSSGRTNEDVPPSYSASTEHTVRWSDTRGEDDEPLLAP